MKRTKALIGLVFIMISMISFSQTNFKWDVVIDSLEKNKSELYTQTKLYIAETWKSAQNVIQNDDKEGGVILVKGLSVQNLVYQMNDHRWTFSYSIKFLMKDNKCRIIIDEIHCTGARVAQNDWPLMPVGDEYPAEKGLKTTGVNAERYLTIMAALKRELQSVVDSYTTSVKTPLVNNSDW